MTLSTNDSTVIAFGVCLIVVSLVFLLLKIKFKDEIELRQNFYDNEDDTEDVVAMNSNENEGGVLHLPEDQNKKNSSRKQQLDPKNLSTSNHSNSIDNLISQAPTPRQAPTNPILFTRIPESTLRIPQPQKGKKDSDDDEIDDFL